MDLSSTVQMVAISAFAMPGVIAVSSKGIDDLYAIPVLLGCTAYVLSLMFLHEYRSMSAFICIAGIFCFPAAVIHWGLSVPEWLMTKPSSG